MAKHITAAVDHCGYSLIEIDLLINSAASFTRGSYLLQTFQYPTQNDG